MRTEYHVTGEQRKEMVAALENVLGECAVYMRLPTYAYRIGDFTVTKDGALEYGDETDRKITERVIKGLAEAGFTSDTTESTPQGTVTDPCESAGLTVNMPRSSFTDEALSNLRKIVDSKAALLKKAIGTDCLDIIETEDMVRFPWFPEPDADEFIAYAHLIDRLCEMARAAKRITAKEHPVESEKYAMRCFLIRLGFGGAECKKMRNILLRNLSGSAAFRTQAEADAFNEKLKAKRREAKETGHEVS